MLALAAGQLLAGTLPPTPPGQPLEGPGSAQIVSRGMARLAVGKGQRGGWVFVPTDPTPGKAPVIVFCHGWGAVWPYGYMAWVRHLVERGYVVIWPRYQADALTPPRTFLPNAIAGVHAALDELHRRGVATDLERVVVAGHSAGAMVGAGMAATASQAGLPPFLAVMCVEPGKSNHSGKRPIPLAKLGSMPASTLLLVVVEEDDRVVGLHDGYRIYEESTQVPPDNKNLLEMFSDSHGSPRLIANHFAPSAIESAGGPNRKPLLPVAPRWAANTGVVDALDYYGTWKLLDALTDAAFYGRNRETALGGTEKQLYMGRWSDGAPVKPMKVLR